MKTKLTLTLLTIALSSASLSGSLISGNADGVMQLPVFYVYASEDEANELKGLAVNTEWKFEKSLDFDSEPVAVQILGPGDTVQNVDTPGIQIDLVKTDIENS